MFLYVGLGLAGGLAGGRTVVSHQYIKLEDRPTRGWCVLDGLICMSSTSGGDGLKQLEWLSHEESSILEEKIKAARLLQVLLSHITSLVYCICQFKSAHIQRVRKYIHVAVKEISINRGHFYSITVSISNVLCNIILEVQLNINRNMFLKTIFSPKEEYILNIISYCWKKKYSGSHHDIELDNIRFISKHLNMVIKDYWHR